MVSGTGLCPCSKVDALLMCFLWSEVAHNIARKPQTLARGARLCPGSSQGRERGAQPWGLPCPPPRPPEGAWCLGEHKCKVNATGLAWKNKQNHLKIPLPTSSPNLSRAGRCAEPGLSDGFPGPAFGAFYLPETLFSLITV